MTTARIVPSLWKLIPQPRQVLPHDNSAEAGRSHDPALSLADMDDVELADELADAMTAMVSDPTAAGDAGRLLAERCRRSAKTVQAS